MVEKSVAARDALSRLWYEALVPSDGRPTLLERPHYGFDTWDQFFAFSIAKNNLQDAGEALLAHRHRGFTNDPLLGYIELWGVLQAVVIHQDAIKVLLETLGSTLRVPGRDDGSAWSEIRDLRNRLGGHPSDQGQGGHSKRRTSTARGDKNYREMQVATRVDGGAERRVIHLGDLLERYDREAADFLDDAIRLVRVQVAMSRP